MRHQSQSVDDQRTHSLRHVRVFDRGLPRQSLDGNATVSFVDPIEAGDAVDVDQVSGPGEAEVEQGDEGLPAGQDLRVL
jgi:hypothetical protein